MPHQPFTPASFTTFGDLLRYLRRRERLTQLELSIAVGYAVYRVAFSPDGTRLASAGRNLIGQVYTVRIEELVTDAQMRVTRTLTTAECQQFLHVAACPNKP